MKEFHMEYHRDGYRICKHCGHHVGGKARKGKRKGKSMTVAFNGLMIQHLRTHDPEPRTKIKMKCFLCSGLELHRGKVSN